MALGGMGMAYDDFRRLTPEQFNETLRAWGMEKDRRTREGWEQARFVAACSLAPWSREALRPTDIVTFPWEREADDAEAPRGPEELAARMAAAIERYGLDT